MKKLYCRIVHVEYACRYHYDYACHVANQCLHVHDTEYTIIGTGSRQNQWSVITIRVALAVYTISPSAYEALKSFGILQLPSKATLQAYTGAFRDEAG